MEEQHISHQNSEQIPLHQMLLQMSQHIENNDQGQIESLTQQIFREFSQIVPEGIDPTRTYTMRWSNVITNEHKEENVIFYEMSFEPQQLEQLMSNRRHTVRETTKHLATYRKIKDDDPLIVGGESCTICFESYRAGEYKRTLEKCDHTFHKKCVDQWFVKNPRLQCPLCRADHSDVKK